MWQTEVHQHREKRSFCAPLLLFPQRRMVCARLCMRVAPSWTRRSTVSSRRTVSETLKSVKQCVQDCMFSPFPRFCLLFQRASKTRVAAAASASSMACFRTVTVLLLQCFFASCDKTHLLTHAHTHTFRYPFIFSRSPLQRFLFRTQDGQRTVFGCR